MRIKIIENTDGTFSMYNQTEKKYMLENTTKKECDELKKQIDQYRRHKNQLSKMIR